MRKQFSRMRSEGASRNKAISMLIVFTLLLSAISVFGIPCMAEASGETIYYYNDFSDASADNRYWSNRGAGIVDGQFYLYRGLRFSSIRPIRQCHHTQKGYRLTM